VYVETMPIGGMLPYDLIVQIALYWQRLPYYIDKSETAVHLEVFFRREAEADDSFDAAAELIRALPRYSYSSRSNVLSVAFATELSTSDVRAPDGVPPVAGFAGSFAVVLAEIASHITAGAKKIRDKNAAQSIHRLADALSQGAKKGPLDKDELAAALDATEAWLAGWQDSFSAQASTPMHEERFWAVVSTAITRVDEEWDSARARRALSALSDLELRSFRDRLAEKLFGLDGRRFATGNRAGPVSSDDAFLYSRLAAVASGQQFYEAVLANPAKMPLEDDGEVLLLILAEMWQDRFGTAIDWPERWPIESGSNRAQWT
jgi:hypothetical protein